MSRRERLLAERASILWEIANPVVSMISGSIMIVEVDGNDLVRIAHDLSTVRLWLRTPR